MGTLPRHVLVEVIKVFVVALVALTMMMLIVGLVRQASAENLPLAQIAKLIPFILPEALRFTLPVTFLLAVTTVYGRMSGMNEVIALKALGVSPVAILSPSYILAFLLSLGTVQINDIAVSWGRAGAERVVTEAIEEIAYSMLRTQRCYVTPIFSINVKRVENQRLLRVSLSIEPRGKTPGITINAAEAELHFDPDRGVLKIVLRDGSVDVQGRLSFQFPDDYTQEIPIRNPKDANEVLAPSSMPMRIIPEQVAKQKKFVRGYEEELAGRAAYQMALGDFGEIAAPAWRGRHAAYENMRNHLNRLHTEPWRRWAAGFSCFFFAWIGAPLAIRLRNSDYLTSFFLCFLPILVVYYPLLMFGVDGAKHGTIPPASVWAGNVLLGMWGFYLLRRVMRY